MNERENNLVGVCHARKVEEREEAKRTLAKHQEREKKTYCRYVLQMDNKSIIKTNKPDRWLEMGARLLYEVDRKGEVIPRRGRPRKQK